MNGSALDDDNVEGEARNVNKSRDSSSVIRRTSLIHFPRLPSVRHLMRASARGSIFDLRKSTETKMEANEERLIFIKALRAAYHLLIERGEVER